MIKFNLIVSNILLILQKKSLKKNTVGITSSIKYARFINKLLAYILNMANVEIWTIKTAFTNICKKSFFQQKANF